MSHRVVAMCDQPGEDILDDLSTRFMLNMPVEERGDSTRVCYHLETAYWFYLDFHCASRKQSARLNLKRFAQIMFGHIPSFKHLLDNLETILDDWSKYKGSVPCAGAILLDPSRRFVLLVQGMSRNWSFPKGKQNQQEALSDCAIREVLEETGYDCSGKLNEHDYLDSKLFDASCRLFVVQNVELEFDFRAQVRGEIHKIEWFRIEELAKRANDSAYRFTTVVPFVNKLLVWIEAERERINQGKMMPRQVLKRLADTVSKHHEAKTTCTSSENREASDRKTKKIKHCLRKPMTMIDVFAGLSLGQYLQQQSDMLLQVAADK